MKQRFQCNLQPEIQERHRTTHTDTTTRCKTHRRNNSRTKRPQPHPSHRRGTFHRRLQPLYTEKHKVCLVLRLPPQNNSPCNIHAATAMRFATSRGKPAPIYARGNIKWRQWSSDSNAICNQRFKNRIELRTQTQPLVAKHIGGTWRNNSRTKRLQPHPSHRRGTFHRRLRTEKHKVCLVLRLPPQNNSPCNIHAAIAMRFATSRGKPAPIYARGNIKWRQWSSDSNAICNQRFKNGIELRTQT